MTIGVSPRRGQAAIFITMSLVVTLGLLGLVVDVGWAYWRKLLCKTAAQSAAMAAVKTATAPYSAQASIACSSLASGPLYVGCQYAAANGVTDGGRGGAQSVKMAAGTSGVPVSGLANVVYWVTATASETVPWWFTSALGASAMTVAARATAVIIQPTGGGCVYTLGTSGTSISASGGASLSSGCGLYVDSSSGSAISMSGGASITTTGGAQTNIVGGDSLSGGATISPAPVTGVPAASDPFASDMPAAPTAGSCQSPYSFSGGGVHTISVGTYCNGISGSGGVEIILTSGTYYVENGISLSGGSYITATGPVTIYMATGSVSMSGGAYMVLSAPTSGSYNGLVFWQASSDTSDDSLTGGALQQLNGVVYIPNAGLTYSGGSGSGTNTTIVSKTLTLSGGSHINGPASSPYFQGAGLSGKFLVE